MGKVIFKPKWAKYWGITSMDIEPDCELLSEVGYVYIHRYGDTTPCCKLKKVWIKNASFERDGETITVVPRPNGAQDEDEEDDE